MEEASQSKLQDEALADQNQSSSSSMPIRQMPQPVPPRKSNLMKEVESLGSQSLEVPRGLDASELHMTRQKARKLQGIAGKPSLFNVKETGYKFPQSDDIDKLNSVYPKRSKTTIKSEIVGGKTDPPTAAAAKSILSKKRAEGLIKWKMWEERKGVAPEGYSHDGAIDSCANLIVSEVEKITEILQSRHYNIASTLTEDFMIGINDDLKGYNLTIQDGLHVFRPTAEVMNDFENFLQRAEDIAGRETGVVKVILPKELLLPSDDVTGFPRSQVGSSGQKAGAQSIDNMLVVKYLTKLDLRVSELQYLPIYDVHMMGGLRESACTCRRDVQSHRRSILELHGKDENYRGDIFNEIRFAENCEEEKMVECGAHSSTNRYYSADIEASNEKRSALNCGKLQMREFHSHGLFGAQTDRDKIHQPKLQIAGAFGSSFGLQMTSFGAYSLNVLHSGAPKCWTVIKPADHGKIEFQLHPDAEEASLRGKRIEFVRLTSVDIDGASKKNQKKVESLPPSDFPPRCDQFLNHQPFYIPTGSLEAYGVGFIQVVQYEGELIIRFPFAYSQGYSCGPSIAEEVGYTNERSEILNQEGLYCHCHAACTGPKPPIDFGAFPTAAASDARRMDKTLTAMPPSNGFNCRTKGSTASLNMAMNKRVIQDDDQTLRSKELESSTFEDQERMDEAWSNKQENQGVKKDKIRRRRLVRASDLPGYKA